MVHRSDLVAKIVDVMDYLFKLAIIITGSEDIEKDRALILGYQYNKAVNLLDQNSREITELCNLRSALSMNITRYKQLFNYDGDHRREHIQDLINSVWGPFLYNQASYDKFNQSLDRLIGVLDSDWVNEHYNIITQKRITLYIPATF